MELSPQVRFCIDFVETVNPYLKAKGAKVKNINESKHSKDKFVQSKFWIITRKVYKERSYEALFRNGNQQKVDTSIMQNMLAQKRVGATFLSNKINKISFMN